MHRSLPSCVPRVPTYRNTARHSLLLSVCPSRFFSLATLSSCTNAQAGNITAYRDTLK
ncbi:hypothetical protein E2C01_084062 [Portunus trituberculatus]|uniref:Uncharacterized protein n=1 Tax=Portunus trituberculatus TaxID=210409 RepID=A0A5B7J396_PORTR|nr:hypothetical protein [Portunus trituberculatus]